MSSPAIPGVAALPGPTVDPGQPAATWGSSRPSPDTAPAGAPVTISGTGLPAGKDVMLTWGTANVNWVLDPRADSVDYLGRSVTKYTVQLAKTKTDASGAFSVNLKAPRDFGGIHDIYAVVDGTQVAKGGLLIARSASITPKGGPIGTPITVTYSGLGSSLYEGGASLLYDNKYAGAVMANWTRGVAQVPDPRHRAGRQAHDRDRRRDLVQVPEHPAVADPVGNRLQVRLQRDAGQRPARAEDRLAGQRRADVQLAHDARPGREPVRHRGRRRGDAEHDGRARSSRASPCRQPGSRPNTSVDLGWATVVGNRVNCTGTCWSFVTVPLGTAKVAADGTVKSNIQVPDGLGGWHVVQVSQGGAGQGPGAVLRQAELRRARASRGSSSSRGSRFTIHLKGLGWTQLDNTIAVDYDNSYVGYGCGFNSNGDMVMNMVATGAPGTHLIDMYPLLYTQQPSYPNTPYGMVPVLTYQRDAAGLALGYQLPAMRLAITVVK